MVISHSYKDIISLENLLEAWKEFLKGKRGKKDIQDFERDLMKNIISLHNDLVSKTYEHSAYQAFNISDPKPRSIHKASVRDRLLHHAIYRILYSDFDKTFIADSYSCRKLKGTHKALDRFRKFVYKVSENNTKTCWVLKCDVRKFFASVDQGVLLEIVGKYIKNEDINWLLSQIVKSFSSTKEEVGLPLGNLTSQLLVNVYMNEFDHFVKHKLKAKYYIRYADDFVLMHQDKEYLVTNLRYIANYLGQELKLQLHPDKILIKTLSSGIDFLGWVHFYNHRVLRTSTKRKMMKRLKETNNKPETVQSYLGMLRHGNTQRIKALIT